jgi:hypothetical protein
MRAYPYLVHKDTSGESLQPVEHRERTYDEAWLQELLRQNPDILPVAEIEPIFSPLIPIGREVVAETGAIDNLFISHRGYLVLVETKLWRNPEARREVLAQAIDYASAASKWNYSRLDEVTRRYTQKYEYVEMGLTDWVEKQCGPIEGGQLFFEETVAKNLRLGRFLTLVVGDRIRRSVIEMLSYINKYPHLATDVALVELQCYRWKKGKDWPLLVVPSIVARTEVVERSVIQVTLRQDGTYQVDARQERVEEKDKRRRGVLLSEEAFWELLEEQTPDALETARQLIERYREKDGISIEPTESSIVARLDIQDTGRRLSLFFLNKNGALCVWPATIRNQLALAEFQRALTDSYEDYMRDILHMDKARKDFAYPVAKVDTDKFTSAVDAFIEKVQLAEPIND